VLGDDVWAWIAEKSDEQDGLYASGRFGGHLEVGDDLGEQLDDASLEEALRWARERADVVMVRLWDSDYFFAGERNPFPDDFPHGPRTVWKCSRADREVWRRSITPRTTRWCCGTYACAGLWRRRNGISDCD